MNDDLIHDFCIDLVPAVHFTQCHTYLGSAAEAMERLGMTVQPGQAEQLKQFTQVPQLDRMLGLREGR